MKKVFMITCLVAGLAGITVAQTTPSGASTAKTEKTTTVKHKAHSHIGKHKKGAHHTSGKHVKS